MFAQNGPFSQDSGHSSSSNSSLTDRLSPCSTNLTILDTNQYNTAKLPAANSQSLPSSGENSPNAPNLFFKEHNSIDTNLGNYSADLSSEESTLCDQHNVKNDFFCYDCVMDVCFQCIRQQHTQHYLYPGITCKELFRQMRKSTEIVKQNLDTLERQERIIQTWYTVTIRNINEFFKRVHELLNDREQKLMKDAGEITDDRMQRVAEKIREHKNGLDHSNQVMTDLYENITNGDYDFARQNSLLAKKDLETLRSLQKSLSQFVDPSPSLILPDDVFLDKLKIMGSFSLDKSYNKFGHIGHRSTNFDTSPSYRAFPPLFLQSPGTQLTPSTSALLTPENYNLPMLPFIGNPISTDTVPISPLSLMPPDNLNVFPVSFHTRRHYSKIRRPVTVFGQEGSGELDLCRPWGVCCDRNGNIIVADRSNNRIQIFRSDGSHVLSFGHQGSENGEFNRPAGVAVDQYNRIIVTDKDNHRVQVFTMQGEFIFTFGERGQANGKFHYPWDVDVSEDGIIAISDTRNHRVQMFTANGKFMKKFGFENASNMWKFFDSPRGVCFTAEKTLMVTDFNNHRLYEVVVEGPTKLINVDSFKRCELFRPQGIAMDADGNILVADCRNNRIQVFSRIGDPIGSFGVAGKELGQFDRPSGIALTPDGKIVVVDFGNHRIQIF